MASGVKVNTTRRVLCVVLWYEEARYALAGLAAIQLLYILVVGLAVCLAFSYAFSVEEFWAWLSAVGKSVLMQLFVTDPALGTVMLVLKLLVGWLLLRCEIRAERKRRVQMLDEREKELELSEVKSVNNMKVVNAKLEALKVVARGDQQVVRTELRKKQGEKVRVTEKLHKVVESIEDARMDGLKGLVKELKKEERCIKTGLRAVEVALDSVESSTETYSKEEMTGRCAVGPVG